MFRFADKLKLAIGPLGMLAALILTSAAIFPLVVAGQSEACAGCKKTEAGKKAPGSPQISPVRIDRNSFATSVSWREKEPQEKAIAVSPKVFVSVCVRRGAVRINGWERNEVRVFHRGGDELGINVLERGSTDVPTWVEVLGFDPRTRPNETDKCVSGDMIELDVPEGAAVTIKGLSSETSVERVRSASVEIVGGDIYLGGISERIDASTQQGGVTVNDSKGRMSVTTTTGNIVAYNTEPVEPGDFFRAKTRSGAITLQSIGQKEIGVSTITGSINYVGEIKNYGRYEFTTTNGILNLVLPESAAFWLSAAYGGEFVSDFPLKVTTENETESAFYVKGRVGSGDANLSVKSFSGTIRLRKRVSGAVIEIP